MHIIAKGWLPLTIASSAALVLWSLAAAHGYGWQTIWLPATVAGAAWPRGREPTLHRCLARRRERRNASREDPRT